MTCPDCERHKLSASMWRNKAYEASGTPLPWEPEELLRKEYERGRAAGAAEEREACAKVCENNATDLSEGDWDSACINCADHIRARGEMK